ncbi:MAG: HlyC/CorC family transporter [Clostridia bacterium]|nr:HlyC/CorC family transporter [Clostridia bacterium]
MDDGSILQVLALIVLLALSAFFSATETAFSSMNRIRVKNLAADGSKKAARVIRLSENFDRLLSTILIGNNIVNISTTAIATLLFIKICDGDQALGTTVATVVVTVAVLVFGEITPKTLAKESPESFAMASAPFIAFLGVILWPLNIIFTGWRKLVSLFIKPKEDRGVTEDELLTIVEEAENEGDMQSSEVELIRNAIEFNDIEVSDILQPRVNVEAISRDMTWEEIDHVFRTTGYSRLPVYTETIDDMYGVVNQKDFYMASKKNLKSITSPIDFVVPTMKISELLIKLQKSKSHMAAVVDEYGGIAGIVTMEDVIEELVGEIWDEHDEVVEEFEKLDDGGYRVKCSAALDDLFELLEIDEELDIPTVSGWVIEELKHIPEVGDTFDYKNLHVTVTECDDRHALEIVVNVVDPDGYLDDDEDEEEDE